MNTRSKRYAIASLCVIGVAGFLTIREREMRRDYLYKEASMRAESDRKNRLAAELHNAKICIVKKIVSNEIKIEEAAVIVSGLNEADPDLLMILKTTFRTNDTISASRREIESMLASGIFYQPATVAAR